jgi:O-methyltransferase involved in polyketide biosynthesis/acyl-coenzyme A thioesterase PaaI-like protein
MRTLTLSHATPSNDDCQDWGDVEPVVKPLSLIPDSEDVEIHRRNCSPKLITRRLRELVPLLEFVDCIVEEVGPDKTILSLRLRESAMNQNGTHQAAVFYLVADYALGVGMFGVLPGVYVTGVHDRCHALPVQYWLKRGTVQHLAPGTGRLTAEVRISADSARDLRRQLVERGRGEHADSVRIYQEGDLVAETEHTMGLYADVPRTPGVRANVFQVQNLKTSALMIAGLRDDALSRDVAQDQGRAIACRMSVATPQLPSLVKARTIHVERFLNQHGSQFAQALVLGVGLDHKPILFSSNRQRWFGLDLRDMLRERDERFAHVGATAANYFPVAADLRLDSWDQSLLKAGFQPELPTIVIAEGISMYLSSSELAKLLRKLRALAVSPKTRLWIDHVSPELFHLDVPEVKAFLASMSRLGEPFVAGFNDASRVDGRTWTTDESKSAADVLSLSDAVYREYRFSILRPNVT